MSHFDFQLKIERFNKPHRGDISVVFKQHFSPSPIGVKYFAPMGLGWDINMIFLPIFCS